MIQRGLSRIEYSMYMKRWNMSFSKDLRNRLIYCDPLQINQMLLPKVLGSSSREFSGFVATKDIFNESTFPLKLHPKIKYCFAHFESKLSWKDSGAYDYYSSALEKGKKFDKIRCLSDLTERFQSLGLLYENVANSGRLQTRFELGISADKFDEGGGIYVHFDAAGKPIFGGGGFHRLAIAQILRLHKVPVCVGVIHSGFENDIRKILRISNA